MRQGILTEVLWSKIHRLAQNVGYCINYEAQKHIQIIFAQYFTL